MAENPNNRLQKFNGSKSAIRPESWIKLYDFENNSLKEDEKIKNLMYYLTDSALEWYADEIISNPAIKSWEVVKEKLIQRFGSYNANPIVSASHRRLKREESIENYFQDKIRLLNQTHLTKEEKIHLLTDGLPNDWKDLIVAAQPTDTTKWFHIAASIEQNRASIQFKPKNKIHLATKNNDNRKNVCPFWCPICSKKGKKIKHWVTDCEDYDPNYKKDRPNQNTSVKQVCGAPELLNVSTLTNTHTQGAFKLINISVEVNGIPAQAFVDTGATVSIINWRLFKRTRLQLQPNSDIHISQADGVTRTCGRLQTKVRIDKLIKPVTLHVMKNFKYPLLIGLDVASLFNLLIDVRDKTIYTKFDGLQNPILVNHLEDIREHELKELLEHNRNVFSQHAIDLGKVAIQHKIITKSEQPISLRPYRRSLKEYEEIAEQVKELLEHKLIRTSDSPWAFPVVMVPKKDGNKRMCIDYRRLNEITLDDRQPLPHIQDMFDRLHGSRFFSTLDVAWGYWQIEMDPQSIQKTAFVTNDGHYEFLVMPFGLKNAASTFQRIIQHILGELLWKGTCSFQDDILVYTKTWQEHIELLSKVFDKLRQYNMKLKLSKCIFGRTEVKYLRHIISHNQLKPDPGKVKSIQDFPRPDTVKKVRQFMGLANYYRKFAKDFSKISFPLVRLTRKNQPFIWNEEVEESFAKLKMALSTKPVLAIYNPDYPSKVYTDASKYGIGAILTQIGPDNEEHVIAYYSKTLQPHQENYSAYEMECLAVIQATDHFHVYIENQPFEIITDHAALQWLFTMKKPKHKYFRWILSLSSKSCNIVHRSGKQQTHVDALSRLPVVNIATQELQEHQQNSDLSFFKNSHTHDGVVMIKQKGVFKAVVPNSLTKKILEEYHDSLSHPSITKTCKLITQCYWWKGITTDIKNYVRSCKSCQLVKVRHEPTLGEMITPTSNIQPLQMIGCDTIVLGTAAANTKHKFIQVFVDHATRYLWAYPTITNTAQAVTQCLDKIIKSVNSINTILTDNGKNFISKEFNKFLSLQGIKHTYTSPYHPQCNGICEKLNDTIMTKLRIAVLEKPRCKWSSLLPQVVKNYNSTPHDVTGFSPLFLMYGIGNVPEFADQTPITIEEARKKASLRTEQSRSIRSGKGPMSCYSLRRMIKNVEKTGSLEAKPRSGRPSKCKSVVATISLNIEAIETLSTYGEGREPILQPLPQLIEMEDDHRPTVSGSYIPCQRQRDPSTFSGDGNINPGQWLKEYERVSKYNRWDETMKLANVVFYLNGTAGRWFDNNEESLNSWRSFEDAFRGVFGLQEDSARRAEEVLKSRAQKAEESSESYIQEILSLCHQVNPRMEEGERVAHIIKGISEDTYQVLVAKDIQTVDEILKFCRHLTTVKQRRIGRTKFARLSNVMPISCVDDSDDLAALIRRIVREEIQKVFSAPEVINPLREVNALEQTVREEVSRALQPTRPQVNVVQQQPRTPYYNIDRPTQPRKTEHWRTHDDKPICFHCGRPGHVVRYCRERRQVFAEARSRNGGEGRNPRKVASPKTIPVASPSFQPFSHASECENLSGAASNGGEVAIEENPPGYIAAKLKENFVMVEINGRKIKALVDSGADFSVISDKFRRELKTPLFKEPGPILKAANKNLIETLGKCVLNIEVNGLNISFEFVVMVECSHDIIFGWDFFKATEAVIDCGRNELHLGETSVLESREEENQRLFASDDFVIPPKSIKKISVINEEICGVRDVLVSTSKDLLLRKEVLIPNSLVTFRHGRGSIWVANGASWPQLIPSGMNMCTMESYENGNICNLIESSDKLQETQLKSREWSQKINLTLDPGLSEIQRLQLVSCLDEFIGIFDFGSTPIKPTSTVKHKINTGDQSPIKQRPYRVAPSERRLIQDEVNKMIENHIVKPSESPWSSPVILVRKKDGTWRFCVDYRRLNKITKKDVYPLPRIDDALDSLAGSSYFSTMDLRSGYWQIEVDEKDREKTAFITPDGLYEFQVMPFGLCNAPATFERMIDSVLGSLKWNMCLCYLDDIVVYAPTFEEHLRRLQLVLSCIQKAGLSLNHKKCLFGSRRIKILGHLVDANGIHPDPDKVEAVSKFPRPRNISELKSFLGLCSYYRRFIENFAGKARSLHDLLKTEKQFYWDAAQEKAFEVLKTALISEPVLGHFDESADTHLHTDASGHGIGAVLLQIQGGKERPIAYASRSLTKAENNYSTTEKECLAVVWSISKFRPYLFGRPFTVVTDHHSLCWLVGQKDPSGRLARWALKLQEFDVTVIYKSGRKHKDADCLSRSPLENDQPSAVMSLTNVDIEQTKDPDLAKIIDNLNSGYTRKEFSIIDGILYKKNYSTTGRPWLMMIPKHLRSEVMADLHDAPTAGHLGFARTYDKVKKRFYWPGLYRTVRQYVSHCRECQRRKKLPRHPAGQLVSIPPVEKPFYKIGVDLLGRFPVSKDGNRWIIVCTDYMTRYAITKAIPDGGAIETAKFLVEDVILKHGAPREMITDRGRNFISQVIKEINALCGIVHRFTTAYHPQTNGLTERFNKTLGDMLSMYTGVEQKDWDQVLPYVTFAYNTAKQEATGYTPFFLVHAREAETYIDAVLPYLPDEISNDYVGELVTRAEEARQLSRSRLLQSQAKDRRLYDQKHTPVYYQKDDLVWVFTPIRKVGLSEKLLKRYFGPYKVTKKLSEVTYEVEPVDPSPRSRKAKDIVHVIRMKPYLDPEEQHSILLGNTSLHKWCRKIEASNKKRVNKRVVFDRLPNVAAIDSADSESMEDLIRRIVREEVHRALNHESTTPEPSSLKEIIREEIEKNVASISKPIQRPPPRQSYPNQTRTFSQVPRRQYPTQTPIYNQTPPQRRTDVWRTHDNIPICFNCGRPGHVKRYCRERRQWTQRPEGHAPSTQEPQMGNHQAIRSQIYRRQSPYPNRGRSPRRQSISPGRHTSQSPRRYNLKKKLSVASSFEGEAAGVKNPPSSTAAKLQQNYVEIIIDDIAFTALIDSGSSFSVISDGLRRQLKKTMFKDSGMTLKVADGKNVTSIGRCTISLRINGLQ
ncbi:hypothetical protein LAZ67_19001324, partial [Cordylochernes scorpioides]